MSKQLCESGRGGLSCQGKLAGRMLEFPPSMSPNAVAKALRAEGLYSPKRPPITSSIASGVCAQRLGGKNASVGGSAPDSPTLKAASQKHALASRGYLELGMFDAAANAPEEIEPDDKTRKRSLGARVDLYMAAKK